MSGTSIQQIMTLTCAIIDDEPLAISLLESYVNKTPFLRLAGKFNSALEALPVLSAQPVELLFLDIQMPELSGMEFSRILEADTRIIFTTAFEQYALDSYKVNALDYLLKPIKVEDIRHALDKYGKLNRQDILQYLSQLTRLAPAPKYKDKLLVPYKDKLLPVNLKDVSCFYTSGKNTFIYLKDGEIAERGTHQELLAKRGLYYETYMAQYGTFLGGEAM